jgi:hypothetical protein
VNATLRIDADLHQRLRKAADARHGTLNSEVKWRLERSFQEDATRTLDDLVKSMKNTWILYGERFLALRISEEILQAIRDGNFERASVLVASLDRTVELAKRGDRS